MRRQLSLCLIVVLGLLAAQGVGGLRALDNALTEFRFSLISRDPTRSVVLVDIDAQSLSSIGTWPWPRQVHASLIEKLTRLGASEIAFDIDFSAQSNPDGDLALETALRGANGAVVLAAFNQQGNASSPASGIQANLPLERFAQNAWSASVNVPVDADGAVRRFAFGESVAGKDMPSIAALLGGHMGEAKGDFLIDFGIRAGLLDRISAIDVLEEKVDAKRIAGRKTIVGATAVELRDLFHVPVNGIVSGSMVQALATESILQQRALKRSGIAATTFGVALLACGALALWPVRWTAVLGAILAASLTCEGVALLVQEFRPVIVDTSVWQATLGFYALGALSREISIRRILLRISGTETDNARTILSQVIHDSFAGVIVADEKGVVLTASKSASYILGFDDETILVGRLIEDVLPKPLAQATATAIAEYQAGSWKDTGARELQLPAGTGEFRVLEYAVRPSRQLGGLRRDGVALPDRFVASLTFADVTDTRKSREQLSYLARFDPLTGLANRNLFCERLDGLLEPAQEDLAKVAVLFFDVDRFHMTNETLGHTHGDSLLCGVAARTSELLGAKSLLSRFGGDAFALLALEADAADGGVALADRLIRSGREPYEIDGHRVFTGINVGIAPAEPGMNAAALLQRADMALSRAKAAGRNLVSIYDQSMDQGLQARRKLEVDLWDAFERSQFEVQYQPQVTMTTGRIVGVEALLRWKHPDRGYVSPAEFIPLAEAVGLIDPLGFWVLKEACKTVANWPEPIRLAVNVSPVQFSRGDLAGKVQAALHQSGLSSRYLDLEITESLFLAGGQVVAETVAAIQATGVSFAIDDFGTGYSSLGYLMRFPARKVKIDKSFIDGLPLEPESVAVVRAMITLAHSLRMSVVAEGIETMEQAAALRALGCDEGQGWLFGKAVSGKDLEQALNDHLEYRLRA